MSCIPTQIPKNFFLLLITSSVKVLIKPSICCNPFLQSGKDPTPGKTKWSALEIEFKFIPTGIVYDLNKILQNYQIKIIRYIDGSYVKNTFNNDIELSEMTHKILTGHNENEVTFTPINIKKLCFFEKFFQLFS